MRIAIRLLLLAVLAVLALAAYIVYFTSNPVARDAPRDLPWTLPDYRAATTSWHVGEDGKIYTSVEHFFLESISPAMVAWFYQQLPLATVELGGKTMPLYHIFHPTEHGRLWVLEPAPGGEQGMALGAVIQREEWFGPFDSRGAARFVEFSDAGMLAIPEFAGIAIGSVRHSYTAENGGTRYRVDTVIGADLPLLGPVLNWYLRTQVFHPDMLVQWQRHQVEEVSSLQFFLPALYAQRGNSPVYVLE